MMAEKTDPKPPWLKNPESLPSLDRSLQYQSIDSFKCYKFSDCVVLEPDNRLLDSQILHFSENKRMVCSFAVAQEMIPSTENIAGRRARSAKTKLENCAGLLGIIHLCTGPELVVITRFQIVAYAPWRTSICKINKVEFVPIPWTDTIDLPNQTDKTPQMSRRLQKKARLQRSMIETQVDSMYFSHHLNLTLSLQRMASIEAIFTAASWKYSDSSRYLLYFSFLSSLPFFFLFIFFFNSCFIN